MSAERGCARRPRTDLGTIVLHWVLVAALMAAILTGLSIAHAMPGHDWLDAIGPLLPTSEIWANHYRAALAVIMVSVAYAVYVARAALVPRNRLDAVRLRGFSRRPYRWSTVNVVLHWVCYLTLVTEIATGVLLYLDRGGAVMLRVHWIGMWAVFGFLPAHLAFHLAFGGPQQLLRLFRPAPLPPRPPPFDAAGLEPQDRAPPAA
jgi:cytochrome b561